jgi:hypothetical protein
MEPYAPRHIEFRGQRRFRGWRLKVYSIALTSAPVDLAEFETAFQAAELSLPDPDAESGRPGLGILIAHQGKTGDYTVLGWWNHENELPLQIWVRRSRSEGWRPAEAGESVCVWDLQVIWHERQAWISAMLAPAGPDADAYLQATDIRVG